VEEKMIKNRPIMLPAGADTISRSGPMALLLIIVLSVLLLPADSPAINLHPDYDPGVGPLYKSMVAPNQQLRVHRVSNVFFSITNYGKLGSEARDIYDPETQEPAPSCEFPAGSNLEYLFQGCVWIGAIQERPGEEGVFDTLVSIGDDGWFHDIHELLPSPPPAGEILKLSTRGVNSPPYAAKSGTLRDLPGRTFDAISEQDFVCVYFDTLREGLNVDPIDNRNHVPLGLQILQKSYSWSYEYAEDFILLDFEITNIGTRSEQKTLYDYWIGIYIDADVLHTSEDPYEPDAGAQDDICGFLTEYTDPANPLRQADIYTAWIADKNGTPTGGAFDYRSDRGVSGTRVVNWPDTAIDICDPGYDPGAAISYSFNWWISNQDAAFDFGPQHDTNFAKWGNFPQSGSGTPTGDISKYQVMSNGEFDYDQIFCNLPDWEDSGWIPNNAPEPGNLANGYDTRYLFSFGPFNLAPGEVDTLTLAYICGENLHKMPNNYTDNLERFTDNRISVEQYYNNLDFSDFATNAQWAAWVYDNPGVDTDSDGCPGLFDSLSAVLGDTFYYMGDGVPDFQGPPPPNSPRLGFSATKGVVELNWSSINPEEPGSGSEDSEDLFTGIRDFEGYGIYFSYDNLNWTLLRRFDKIDWLPLTWDSSTEPIGWKINVDKMNPITSDSVLALGGTLGPVPPENERDTLETYWVDYSHNLGFGEILADSSYENNVWVYHYSFTVQGLSQSRGIYFSVTAFDFGNAQTNLSSLESAKSINATLIYPIEKSDPIMVYPNPYKTTNTAAYIDKGYEDPTREGWVEQDRRIWFSNFPDDQKAIIRIWSLDGDLIRAITYPPANYIGAPPGITSWDLVSRNGQAVVSGIYLYSIEFIGIDDAPDRESEIGKFVIIK
jgi:hypothetical protein